MSVNVNGGSLDFSLGFDLESLEKDLRTGIDAGVKGAKYFENELVKASSAGGRALVSSLQEAMSVAEKIGPLIQKSVSNIDPSKLDKLNQEVNKSTNEFEILNKTISFIKENIGQLNLNPEELLQLKQGIEKIDETFKNLNVDQKNVSAELRNIKATLISGQAGSFFDDLVKRAAELQERIKGVKTEIKLAGSNAPGLIATGQAVRGLVASFSALQGTLALVSGGNEDVEKTTQSLIASMSILQGISEISQVLEKDSALNILLTAQNRRSATVATSEQVVATEALTVSQAANAAATESAAVAQTSLNAAIKANPAAVLLTGLTAVVAAISFFTSRTKDAAEQTKAFNLELSRIGQDATDLIDRIKHAADLNNEIARGRGATESDITKRNIDGYNEEASVYRESILKKQTAAKAYFTELGDLSTVYLSSLSDVEDALKRVENAMASPNFDQLTKGFKQKFNDGKATLLSLKQDYQKIQELQDNAELQSQKLIQQRYQEALRSAQGYADAALLIAQRNTKEELQLQINAINARATAEANAGNITAGERSRVLAQAQRDIEEAQNRFRIIALENDKAFIEARLAAAKEGSAEELKLKIDLITKSQEIELSAIGLTEGQKEKIMAEGNRQIIELNKKYLAELKETEIETRIATINTSLSLVRAGTEEELSLKKSLINEQANLDIAKANEQIKKEELLQAKIQEILAASLSAQKKLQEDFVRDSLAKRFEQISRSANLKTDPLDAVLSSTRTTTNEKYLAQIGKLEIALEALKKKQAEVSKELQNGSGNCEELTKQFEDLQKEIDKTSQEIDNTKMAEFSKRMKKLASDISSISSAFAQLADSLSDTNPELADTLNTLSGIGDIAGSVVSAIGQFATGDIAGGIASSVKSIAGIFNLGKEARESRRQALNDIDEFYTRIRAGELELTQTYRERARDLVQLNKIRIQGLVDEKNLLLDQKKVIRDQYDTILAQLQAQTFVADKVTDKYGGFLGLARKTRTVDIMQSLAGKSFEELEKLFSQGRLTGKAKDLFEMLQKIKSEGEDIDSLLAQNAQTFKETITGTNADSISQSIIDGFKNGLRSASDFAATFKELMQNALLQALQLKYLEAPLKNFFDEFAALSESDNQLSSSEVVRLQEMFNTIISNANQQFEQLQQVAGINFSSSYAGTNSLAGAIKGITEQQAELLAGQFGGLRITAIDILSISRQQLTALNAIQVNTATQVARMQIMIDKMIYYYEVKGVKVY
ncbi:MAG: hypothetical protein U0U70_15220 [Chitinophagaceae bacterium]